MTGADDEGGSENSQESSSRAQGAQGAAARTPDSPLWKRLGWMALIWTGSVAVLGVVASIIRYWLSP